jgi:hypothetical protein
VVVEPPAEFRKWAAGLRARVPAALMESVIQDTETDPIPVGTGGA